MGTRRQPSEQFIRRLKGSSKPAPMPAALLSEAQSKASLCNRWGHFVFRGLEVLALLFVIPTAYVLIVDLEDRQTQRIAQAWQLVTQNVPGNSGKIQALEYLNSEDCQLEDNPSRWSRFTTCGVEAVFLAPKQRVPLTGLDLSTDQKSTAVYLNGVELPLANLAKVDLARASLREANLSNADLSDADLSNADMVRADLSGADMLRADLSGADLMSVNLLGADLGKADLSGADMAYADLTEATFLEADLSGADLMRADLSRAVFWRANLSGAYLWQADLSGASLPIANLSGADLSDANFRNVVLRNANLTNANLRYNNFSGADLSYANLSGADLRKARQLDQNQLDTACGNDKTKLSEGFTIKACLE